MPEKISICLNRGREEPVGNDNVSVVCAQKIVLFCYLTWFLRFAIAQERSFRIETFKIIVSLSLRITKCSVTHNKVMNFHDFLDYMSSKCGPHVCKMKSWILYRLRRTRSTHILKTFFYRPKMAEILYLSSHLNAMCDNRCVKPARLQSVGSFQERFMPKQSLCIFQWLFLTEFDYNYFK